MGITDRLVHAWNAFTNRSPTYYPNLGESYSIRPDRPRLTRGNERSIVTSVYNRISMDVAALNYYHARLDEDGRFAEVINSNLNSCLNLEANLDQTGRAFIQDVVLSMLDEGEVAIVPTDTTLNPNVTGSYDILAMRTGKVIQWYPEHVKVRLYNQNNGRKEEVILPKKMVGLIENPLYTVINEPNSTAQRLSHKLALLDMTDDRTASGKLDLIIQLPYVVKTEARRKQAEQRRQDIEMQLSGTKYGIAYTDGTERITQLNRSVDNQLLTQIESLTATLYSQLGITKEIMDGTADEKVMLNYHNRTVEPIASAIIDEMRRKFLTKTARSQGQTILVFRDPFKLAPVADIAEIADKFTRNEIMSSNEIRQIIGMKPSDDPNADALKNKNINYGAEYYEEGMAGGASDLAAEDEAVAEDVAEDEAVAEDVAEDEAVAEDVAEDEVAAEETESEDVDFSNMSKEEMLAEFKRRMKELDDLDAELDDLEKQLKE